MKRNAGLRESISLFNNRVPAVVRSAFAAQQLFFVSGIVKPAGTSLASKLQGLWIRNEQLEQIAERACSVRPRGSAPLLSREYQCT